MKFSDYAYVMGLDLICPSAMEKAKAMDNIPCRVTSDLARHEADLRDAPQPQFDLHDEAMFHDLVGKRMASPVQDLLLTLQAIETTRDSFGVDAKRLYDQILPELKRLRQGLYDAWQDSL